MGPSAAGPRSQGYTLLVASSDETVASYLTQRLARSNLRVVAVDEEEKFLEQARRIHPHVAVVDLAYGHNAANLMITILRDVAPRVRIVGLSCHPSLEDGRVVEQGLFYYMTEAVGPKLVEVVEAAVQAVSRDHTLS